MYKRQASELVAEPLSAAPQRSGSARFVETLKIELGLGAALLLTLLIVVPKLTPEPESTASGATQQVMPPSSSATPEKDAPNYGRGYAEPPTTPTPEKYSSPPNTVPPTQPIQTTRDLDTGAFLACRLFEPLAEAANAGLLTTKEFRDGMKQVHAKASAWPQSEVTRASASLLRIFTESAGEMSISERDRVTRDAFFALRRACGQ